MGTATWWKWEDLFMAESVEEFASRMVEASTVRMDAAAITRINVRILRGLRAYEELCEDREFPHIVRSVN